MKTTLSAFLAICWLIWSGQNTSVNLDDGLIAHYTFDQCDARDDTGNGSNGTLFGRVDCWCGIRNDALLFDGVNDYIEFSGPVNRYFSTSDFTISFYFKSWQSSILKQSLLSKRTNCDEYHMFDLQLDAHNKLVDTDIHETPLKDYKDVSPYYVESGWHHYALVRSGSTVYTYIDGQLQKKGFRCSGVDISNSTPLSFSHSPCISRSGTRPFKGVLDEMRIYNRPLSPEEISSLYLLNPIEDANVDCLTDNNTKKRITPSLFSVEKTVSLHPVK